MALFIPCLQPQSPPLLSKSSAPVQLPFLDRWEGILRAKGRGGVTQDRFIPPVNISPSTWCSVAAWGHSSLSLRGGCRHRGLWLGSVSRLTRWQQLVLLGCKSQGVTTGLHCLEGSRENRTPPERASTHLSFLKRKINQKPQIRGSD